MLEQKSTIRNSNVNKIINPNKKVISIYISIASGRPT